MLSPASFTTLQLLLTSHKPPDESPLFITSTSRSTRIAPVGVSLSHFGEYLPTDYSRSSKLSCPPCHHAIGPKRPRTYQATNRYLPAANWGILSRQHPFLVFVQVLLPLQAPCAVPNIVFLQHSLYCISISISDLLDYVMV